jgi:hypothetical protein
VGPDPFSVEKLLAALTTLGLVHPEYAAPPKAKRSGPAKVVPAALPAPVAEPEPPRPAPETPAQDATFGPEAVASTLPAPLVESPSTEAEPLAEALEEPVLGPEPVELPLVPVPEPTETEPVLTSWEPIPPEPLDQAFALPEPPALLRTSRPGLSPIWLLVVLAVAVVALLVFRSRHGGPGARTAGIAALPTAVPTDSATAAATLPPAPIAAATSVAPSPTGIPATPFPSTIATRVPTAIPPTAAAAIAVPAQPASLDRRRWMDRAQRDLRTHRRDRRTRYAIQVELVCELPSLDEAWRYDRRGALWLLPADYRGRECFRVFWGRYATLEEARAAKASVPRFFFTPTNQPAIVSTRALLP